MQNINDCALSIYLQSFKARFVVVFFSYKFDISEWRITLLYKN
jgi:hypothetical protein